MSDKDEIVEASKPAKIEEAKADKTNVKNSNVIITRIKKYSELKEDNPEEYFKKVYAEISDKIYKIDGKLYYYSIKYNDFVELSKAEIFDMILLDYPIFKMPKEQFKSGKDKKIAKHLIPSEFLTQLTLKNYEMLYSKVDLFQEKKIAIEVNASKVNITRNKQYFRDYFFEFDEDAKIEIIEDYKSHFIEFMDILDWIVACRFVGHNRSSFLHLHLNAGFGKSFFMDLFKELALGLECRYEDFKSPSSLSAGEFDNTISMFIDEFTIFQKNFKTMISSIILDSKNKLRTEVDLYSKIFLSAEASPSFSDGVEIQIMERMNSISKKDIKKLGDREVFNKYGNKAYFKTLAEFTNNYIKAEFNKYLSLNDDIKASKEADKITSSFNKKYVLKAENLNNMIKKRVFNRVQEISEIDDTFKLSHKELDIHKKLIKTDKAVFILNPKATIDLILDLEDEAFKSKAKYKKANIEEVLGIEIKTNKIGVKGHRSLKILNHLFTAEFDDEGNEIPF